MKQVHPCIYTLHKVVIEKAEVRTMYSFSQIYLPEASIRTAKVRTIYALPQIYLAEAAIKTDQVGIMYTYLRSTRICLRLPF
jgi:hypothetical protein